MTDLGFCSLFAVTNLAGYDNSPKSKSLSCNLGK